MEKIVQEYGKNIWFDGIMESNQWQVMWLYGWNEIFVHCFKKQRDTKWNLALISRFHVTVCATCGCCAYNAYKLMLIMMRFLRMM